MNTTRSRSRPRRGFALVITVILLALLLLVLVSTATLTHIETSISFNSRRQSQAQQNALFALNRAIGELQRHAGPDQRITATASLLGDGTTAYGAADYDNNGHWTGVWNSDGSGLRTWLVSGNEDRVTGSLNQTPNVTVTGLDTGMNATTPVMINANVAATLVGPKTAGFNVDAKARYVVAPLIDLNAPAPGVSGTPVTGRYAWWVGDEGVKASITETDRHGSVDFADATTGDDYTDPVPANGNRDRIAQLAQPRQRIDAWSASEFGSINPTTSAGQLSKVLAPAQISFVTNGPPLPQLRGKFHDFTVWSRGVLADPSGGGLKDDLSDPLATTVDALDPRLAGFLQLRPTPVVPAPFDLFAKVANYDIGLRHPTETTATTEEAQYWIGQVISEFRMILKNPVADPEGVLVDWEWEVELWNPYNAGLGLSELHVSFDDPGTLSIAGQTIDWMRTITGIAGQGSLDLLLSAASQNWQAELPGSVEPGHVIVVGNSGVARVRDTLENVIITASAPTFTFTTPASPIKVTLKDPDDLPIAVYFPPFVETSGTPFAAIQFRLRDGTDDADWLLKYDPRAPEVRDLPYSPYADDRVSGLVTTDTSVVPSTPPDNSQLAAGTVVDSSFMRVFDLPRQEQISIGALQHFSGTPADATKNLPAFKLGLPSGGGPAGGLENELFDRAFFSTIPRDVDADWEPATDPLPNTRIEIYNPDPSNLATKAQLVALGAGDSVNPESDRWPASRLMVQGAFNINSTSLDAWRALTRGTAISSWNYWYGDQPPIPLSGAFFHHSHTGQDLKASFSAKPLPENSWKQGVRDLTSDQSEELAASIVSQIKSSGQPFRSVADFVNSGILQTAINSTDINEDLAELSPGFLTQADLLTAWAPFLQARSDTFLIRTYGETLNPVTGITEARAWCEAVVQRVPDYVNSVDDDAWEAPTAGSDNETFGRRFKIVQFRWLSPSDI